MAEKKVKNTKATKTTKKTEEVKTWVANHVMYPIEELNTARKKLNNDVAEAMKEFQLVLQSAKQVEYTEKGETK